MSRPKYCDVFGRMLSLLGNLKLDTPVVARQLKVKYFHGYEAKNGIRGYLATVVEWLHGYAHHSVLSRCMVA
jgi:hypothetical protein